MRPILTPRRLGLAAAFLLLTSAAACGKGAQTADPKPEAAAAAAAAAPHAPVNGVGPDGKPIDAVAAAEMDPNKLPPLPSEAGAAKNSSGN